MMKGGKKNILKAGPLNIRIYGRGLIRGYIISLFLFLIVAILITYTSIRESSIPLITSIIMIVGIVFSAISSSIHIKSKGWLHGGIVGLVFVLILVILSKMFISDYSIDRIALYKIGLGMGTGIIGGMLGVNIK